MDSKVFGQFIAKIRKENNMTQADLAKMIGVTDQAVSRWERGIGFPDINTLEPLAKALGISMLELIRSENMKNTDRNLLADDVTEIMVSAVEIAKENQKQEKTITWIGGIVTILVAVFIKIYGYFMIVGMGASIWLFHLMGVDSLILVWGVYCFFSMAIGLLNN